MWGKFAVVSCVFAFLFLEEVALEYVCLSESRALL